MNLKMKHMGEKLRDKKSKSKSKLKKKMSCYVYIISHA